MFRISRQGLEGGLVLVHHQVAVALHHRVHARAHAAQRGGAVARVDDQVAVALHAHLGVVPRSRRLPVVPGLPVHDEVPVALHPELPVAAVRPQGVLGMEAGAVDERVRNLEPLTDVALVDALAARPHVLEPCRAHSAEQGLVRARLRPVGVAGLALVRGQRPVGHAALGAAATLAEASPNVVAALARTVGSALQVARVVLLAPCRRRRELAAEEVAVGKPPDDEGPA
mmetsp:Transcript_53771/g.96796  ORF Transcript_53771/g.96796 Transcript_53771/m.96796 type:complete len:228 (+) Transcript_53771:235-918(+)